MDAITARSYSPAIQSLPLDDDSPFEVRSWIVSVLLAEPVLFNDDEAEAIAGKFHGTGLDLKTASIGELQADSCMGAMAGSRVYERVDRAQGQLESIFSSLKKTTKTWGWDIIPSNLGSSSPPAGSRKTSSSTTPGSGNVSSGRPRDGSESPLSGSRATSIDFSAHEEVLLPNPRTVFRTVDFGAGGGVRRRSAGGFTESDLS